MFLLLALFAIASSRDVKLSELFDGISPSEDMTAIQYFSDNSQIQKLPLSNNRYPLLLPFHMNAMIKEQSFGFYFYFGFNKINLTSLKIENLSDKYYQIKCNQTLDGSALGFSTYSLSIIVNKDLTNQWCVIKFDDRGKCEQATAQVTPQLNYYVENLFSYQYQVPNCSLPSCNQTFSNIYKPKIINFQANVNSTLSLNLNTNVDSQSLAYIVVIGNISARISYINFTRYTNNSVDSKYTLELIAIKANNQSGQLPSNSKTTMFFDQQLENSYLVLCITYRLGVNFQFENTVIDISVRLRPNFIFDSSKTYKPIKNPYIVPPFVKKQDILAQNVPDCTQVILIDQSSQIYKNFPRTELNLKIKSSEYIQGQPTYQNTSYLIILGYVPLNLKQIRINVWNNQENLIYYKLIQGASIQFDGASVEFDKDNFSNTAIQNIDLTNDFVYIYVTSLNLPPFYQKDLILVLEFIDPPFYYDLKLNAFQDCKFGSCSNLASLNFSGDVGVFWINIDQSQPNFEYKVPQRIGRNYSYYSFYVGFQDTEISNIFFDSGPFCKCVYNRVLTQSELADFFSDRYNSNPKTACYNIPNLKYTYLGMYCLDARAPNTITMRIGEQKKPKQIIQSCSSGSYLTSNCQTNCVELTTNVQQSYIGVLGSNSNSCFKVGPVKKSIFIVQAVNLTQPVTLYYTCIPQKSKNTRFVFQQVNFHGVFTRENISSCNLIFWSRQNLKVTFYDYSTKVPASLPYYTNYCLNISQCFVKGNKNKFTNLISNPTIINVTNDGTNFFKFSAPLISKLKKSQTNITIIQLSPVKYNLLIQYQATDSSSPIIATDFDQRSDRNTFLLKTTQLKNYIFGVTYDPLSLLDQITIGIRIS